MRYLNTAFGITNSYHGNLVVEISKIAYAAYTLDLNYPSGLREARLLNFGARTRPDVRCIQATLAPRQY